ncbi:MAG: pyruvate kinase alpha/beta domain-containing protein, partial [Acidimicrobiia bacterium]
GYPAAPAFELVGDNPVPAAIAGAVADTAASLHLDTVVAFTESGDTARLVARYRPNARIVAFTSIPKVCNRLAIVWGVTPLLFGRFDTTDEMIAEAERILLEKGLAVAGDRIAMAAGIPPNQQASTNLLKLHVIGSESSGVPSGSRPT